MNNCLRGKIRRLQWELSKEIEKQLNKEDGISLQSVVKISQTLDHLITQDLREKYSKLKRKPEKKEVHPKYLK